jgi:hypothetical protein
MIVTLCYTRLYLAEGNVDTRAGKMEYDAQLNQHFSYELQLEIARFSLVIQHSLVL